MKVQSWKILLVTIIIGGAALIDVLKDIIAGETLAIIWLIFWLYLILKGLTVSFSKEEHEEDKRRAAKRKQIYRDKFGILAPAMPCFHVIIILFAGLLVSIFPVTAILKIIVVILMASAIAYAIGLSLWVRKQMREGDPL